MTPIVHTPTQAIQLGELVARVLKLKRRRDNKRYDTAWGTFTAQGLGSIVLRMVNDISKDAKVRITLVPRWEHWADGKQATLYFLDENNDLTRYGWRDQHAGASRGFYQTKTSAADHDDPKITGLIGHYLNLPGGENVDYVVRSRLARPVDLRKAPTSG